MTARLYSIGQPVILAHRGGGNERHENSIAAFHAMREAGFTYIETDAHATSDGVPVFFHDQRLERTTDGTGTISSHTWRELQRVRDASGNRIMRVDEALAACPEMVFNIDAKSDAAVEPLARVIRSAGALGRVCVASFSERRLRRLRGLLPGVASSLGTAGVARLVAAGRAGASTAEASKSRASTAEASKMRPSRASARIGQRALAGVPGPESGVQVAQVPLSFRGIPVITRGFLDAAHGRGLAVHAWTINDVELAERLLRMGVDGIVTDVPTAMREHLARQGFGV